MTDQQSMNNPSSPGLQRVMTDTNQLVQAGYSCTIQHLQTGGVQVSCQLPDIEGLSYVVLLECSTLYPGEPPRISVHESGIDSHGEIQENQLMVFVPQVNRWDDRMSLLKVVHQVHGDIQEGRYNRSGSDQTQPSSNVMHDVIPDMSTKWRRPPGVPGHQTSPVQKEIAKQTTNLSSPTSPEHSGRRRTVLPLWATVAGVLVVLVILGVGLVFWNNTSQKDTYTAMWQQIDTALDNPAATEQQLVAIEPLLKQIEAEDPSGTVFPRNAEVTHTYAKLYVAFGDLALREEQYEQAIAQYQKALGKVAGLSDAQAGLENAQSEKEYALLVQQCAPAFEDVPPATQVSRLRPLYDEQVSCPQGDVAQTLFTVLIAEAQTLIETKPKQARSKVQEAQTVAPDDDSEQQAIDVIAQTYLIEASQALEQRDINSAATSVAQGQALASDVSQSIVPTIQAMEKAIATEQQIVNDLRVAWQDYDVAVAEGSWDKAVTSLDRIIGIVQSPEHAKNYLVNEETRMAQVVTIQATTRISYAESLIGESKWDAAIAQYSAVEESPYVAPEQKEHARAARETAVAQQQAAAAVAQRQTALAIQTYTQRQQYQQSSEQNTGESSNSPPPPPPPPPSPSLPPPPPSVPSFIDNITMKWKPLL